MHNGDLSALTNRIEAKQITDMIMQRNQRRRAEEQRERELEQERLAQEQRK